MKIRLSARYVLESDSHGWTCFEVVVGASGKSAGVERLSPVFYAGTLGGCISLLPDYTLRTSQAASVQEAIEEVRALARSIDAQFEALLTGGPDRFQAVQEALAHVPTAEPTPGTGGTEIVPGNEAEGDYGDP